MPMADKGRAPRTIRNIHPPVKPLVRRFRGEVVYFAGTAEYAQTLTANDHMPRGPRCVAISPMSVDLGVCLGCFEKGYRA